MRVPLALLTIGILLALQIALVSPANFGGWDEWFLIGQVDKGLVSIPYTNRPLHYVWALPARLLLPHHLEGFLLVLAFWLLVTAWLVFALARRVLPADRGLALLAGAFAAVWAPLDPFRLSSTIGVVGYAGPTAALMASLLLFIEAFRRTSLPFLGLAFTIAAVTARAFEGVVPLLAFAPVLLLWTRPSRPRRAWIVLWEAGVVVLVLSALGPLLSGQAANNYQLSALKLDPQPLRVASRLLQQFGFHLLPAVTSPPREILGGGANAMLAVAAFLLAFGWLTRGDAPGGGREDRAAYLRVAVLGLTLAALGYSVFVLTGALTRPRCTQFLSAPGIALFLAALARLVAGFAPGGVRGAVAAAFGCWIVALGSGRTVEMQREWDRVNAWPIQNQTLVQLTDQAPGLRPHTLVVLLDEAGAWPAGFTFRHAVEYLYPGSALGLVWNAHPLLYPSSFGQAGVVIAPWPMLRQPWRSPPTLHRYDELVAFRLRADRTLQLEEVWPSELPPLPPGASYEPHRLILSGAPAPASRAILRRP